MNTRHPSRHHLRNGSQPQSGFFDFFKPSEDPKFRLRAGGLALLLITIVLGSTGCGGGPINGTPDGSPESYGLVTAELLNGTDCSYLPEHHEFDFVWSFESNNFLVEGENIAPDLIETLLGLDASAKRIEGTWSIDSDKIELVVNTGDENQNGRTTKLPIYNTGVIRIETPARQYVFSR